MKTDHNRWQRKIHKRRSSFVDHSAGGDLSKHQPNYRHQKRNRKHPNHTKSSNKSKFNHPDFKQKCFLSKSAKLGRAVHTEKSLEVGEVALVSRAYSAVVETFNPISYCLTCHETRANFIRCQKCKTVFFCSKRCKKENLSHQFECGTQFHQIECLNVKSAIQIVLESMATFENVEDLQNFVEQSINDDIPKASNSRESRLDCILKLTEDDSVYRIWRHRHLTRNAYELIITFPKVQQYFELENENTDGYSFLQNFLSHNVSAIFANSFGSTLVTKEGEFKRLLTFDIASYINHSCSPNLMGFLEKTEMTLIATQRIPCGEQLFISYRNFSDESNEERQNDLRKWNFECHCVRCDYGRDISFYEFLRANQLNKMELEHILNKPSKWTPQKGAYICRYSTLLQEEKQQARCRAAATFYGKNY